jgi:glycosyltransferase involved in cell wall biosynthesis
MAHGCCVISTRPTDPATRALLQHDTNMYLVDHVAELPTAITTLAHDSEYRRRLAANACVFAQQFSWQRIAASHIAVYKPILAG